LHRATDPNSFIIVILLPVFLCLYIIRIVVFE